jgi:hypothetical protein
MINTLLHAHAWHTQIRDVGSRVASLRMAATYLHACDAVLVVHDVTQPQVCLLASSAAAMAGWRDCRLGARVADVAASSLTSQQPACTWCCAVAGSACLPAPA